MSTVTSPPAEASLRGKRDELIALSKELCAAHLTIRETATLLKQESEEISRESRVLRTVGHWLRRVLDDRSGVQGSDEFLEEPFLSVR